MASVIEKGNNTPTSSGTTTVVTTSGGATAAGSTLLFAESIPLNDTSGPSVVDSAGNTYTYVDQGVNSGGFAVGVWACENALSLPNGGTATITYGGSLNRRTAMLLELTGVVTVSANDTHVGSTGTPSGTAMSNVATGTLSQASEIVLAFACSGAAVSTSTVAGAWTQLTDLDANQGGTHLCQFGEYQVVAATTTVTASQTQTANQSYAQIIVSYKISTATFSGPPIAPPVQSIPFMNNQRI